MNVVERLQEKGVPFEVLRHPRTFTSISEALALGIQADEVAKCILVDGDVGRFALVLPAPRRVDLRLVRETLGDPSVRLATEAEIEEQFPGFELGALPPVPSVLGVPVYVDTELLEHRTIVFAAGQLESIRIGTEDLFAGEEIVRTRLGRAPEDLSVG